MIFSAPGRERLALNEISLWSGGANPGGGYGYGPDAGTNQFGNYLPFGDLFVDFKKGDQPASLSVEDFTRALDLCTALTCRENVQSPALERRCFIAATR